MDVVTDAPPFYFWKELMEIFPEAKCIFFERDEAAWFKSFQNQMDKICERKKLPDKLNQALLWIISPTMYRYTKARFFTNVLLFFSSKFTSLTFSRVLWVKLTQIICKSEDNYKYLTRTEPCFWCFPESLINKNS